MPLRKPAIVVPHTGSVACLAALTLGAAFAAPLGATESRSVGRVSLVIGVVKISDSVGVVRAAEAGGSVAVGDRIETAAGGHVHLQFIDNGLVSVRPGSQLTIEQYNTDAADTSIRFRLERGVVRSITGEAAKAHKERFRLNTPLAAIGVRGTDFVVKSDAGGLQAMVNQGAIVVATLGGSCVAQSLGPCVGANAFELSDAMGRVLLEMSAVRPPRLAPLGGPVLEAPGRPQPEGGSPSQLVAVAEVGRLEAAQRRLQEGAGSPPGGDVAAGGTPPALEVTPPPLPVLPPALQWGRWSGPARDGDALSRSAEDARGGRDLVIADKYVGLFRAPGESPVLSTQLGQGSFVLAGGAVSLLQVGGGSSAGSVNGGWLKIDFAQRNFSTELALSHPQTGAVQLNAAGKVRDDGVFVALPVNGRVAGAVSFDGTQAGYLFDKALPQGTLTGTTLWKR